jgi:hypothetical protein
MAVEILVLSGNRQGDRYVSSADQFRAGGLAECELFFDPEVDLGARNRSVVFRRTDDGWTLARAGTGEVLLNTSPVADTSRIRSGDIVRLSPQGPDFSFYILGRAPASAGDSTNPLHRTSPAPTVDRVQDAVVDPVQDKGVPTSAEPINTNPVLIASIAVATAVLLLVSIMAWQVLRTGPEAPKVEVASSATPAPAATKATPSAAPAKADLEPSEQANSSLPKTPQVPPPVVVSSGSPLTDSPRPQDRWSLVLDGLRASIYLLAVEQPTTLATWPLGTGCALNQSTLLTSGTVVSELAKFQQQGWKLWAINDSSGAKVELRTLRQHVGFTKFENEPEKRIYFDLGLLAVSGNLPAHAELATRAELASLEPGLPLDCIGTMREVEVLNRFESNEPFSNLGKVFIVTSLPPSPGPRLLHFRANLPSKPYGSPVVNEQGRVCAVFAESAAMPAELENELKVHYAPVVDRELIEDGLSSEKSEVWVVPSTTASPATP